MKKALVLTLAGAMIFSTPVMAKEVGAPEAVYLEAGSYTGVIAETVRAINENKTIQEYSNNAVTDHWDLERDEIQDLAIGKGAVLDGEEAPGLTFNLLKPELKRVYAAKTLAQGKGKLLAVVNVHTHAAFETAAFTFYAPGVKAGDAITVYQRVTDEEWTAVPTVVTDDHVAVEITDNAHLAFIKAEAVAAAPVAPKAAVEKKAAVEEKAEQADVETADVEEDAVEVVVKADEKGDAEALTVIVEDEEESDDEAADEEEESEEKEDAAN